MFKVDEYLRFCFLIFLALYIIAVRTIKMKICIEMLLYIYIYIEYT